MMGIGVGLLNWWQFCEFDCWFYKFTPHKNKSEAKINPPRKAVIIHPIIPIEFMSDKRTA